MSLRHYLETRESLITSQGFWIGREWIYVKKAREEKHSIIHQQRVIDVLKPAVLQLEKEVKKTREQLYDYQKTMDILLGQKEALQSKHQITLEKTVEGKANLLNITNRQFQAKKQVDDYKNDIARLENQMQDCTILQNQQKSKKTSAERKIVSEQVNLHRIDGSLQERSKQLKFMAEQLDYQKDSLHEAEMIGQDLLNQKNSTDKKIHDLNHVLERAKIRFLRLKEILKNNPHSFTVGKEQLAEEVIRLQKIQQQINDTHQRTQQMEAKLLELEQHKQEAEAKVGQLATKRDEARLNWQKNSIYREQSQKALDEFQDVFKRVSNADGASKYDITADEIAEIPLAKQIELQQIGLDGLCEKIKKLGPINLAVDEEYSELAQRKDEIDKQYRDLTKAMEILMQAIEQLEFACNTKFQKTFEQINENLKTVYTRISDNGSAELQFEDSREERGVVLRVQPKGKLIASISLLSGGEKALAALALALAIFKLNASPLCVLDEVDAPLDESNVVRFCQLMKEMSKKIQFIVVTHNRITMEYMDCLMGVTMAEPGVSRLVSVNFQETNTSN